MKIGIIDADLLDNGTRHPNLALMKISGYMKSKGYNVKLLENYKSISEYDEVYLSKVFSFTNIPINIKEYSNLICGGTGLYWDQAKPLDYEIEHHMPDYNLYDKYIQKELERGIKKSYFGDYLDYSIGFTTRGCVRRCKFCINHDKTSVVKHSPINEFLDKNRKYIYLWDDNFLAYPQWKDILNELIKTNKQFKFRQGLDIRLLTDEKAELLSKCKHKGGFMFAFDNIKEKELIVEKISLWKSYYTKKDNTQLYVLCGFDRNNKYDYIFWKQDIIDALERIKILMTHGCIPYIMRYEKYKDSPYRGIYITLARWCNQLSFFKKQSLNQYVYIADRKGKEGKMYASKRYLEEFKRDCPEIAEEYFNLRFEDLNIYRKKD